MTSPSSNRIVVHQHPSTPELAGTMEYFLPHPGMTPKVCQSLDPWLQPLADKRSEEVREVLKARWSSVKTPSLIRLRKLLVDDFMATSIVVYENESWLCLSRAMPGYPHRRDTMLIPSPAAEASLGPMLRKFPAANTPAMVEFSTSFGAIQEQLPPHSGDFCIPKKWETLYDYWGEDDTPRGYGPWYKEWSQALVVFNDPAGDFALLHPDGNLMWLGFAECELWPLAENCDEFLERYVEYRKDHGWLDRDILGSGH